MNWTKTLPTEDGFYWYREDEDDTPDVVEWDQATGTVAFTGSEVMLWRDANGDSFPPNIDGEFWPVRILPPSTAVSERGPKL